MTLVSYVKSYGKTSSITFLTITESGSLVYLIYVTVVEIDQNAYSKR